MDRVLDDVLNKKHPVIPNYADLPRRWREAPSEASDRRSPWQRTKSELLETYLSLASIEPLAREGMNRLNDELIRTGEPIPDPVCFWQSCQLELGDPPESRGPRRQIDEAVRIGVALGVLGIAGYTREKAIAHIAKIMDYSEDGIRSIIRKYHFKMKYPSSSSNN